MHGAQMTLKELREISTGWEGSGKVHESVMKSYHVLAKAVAWLRTGVDPSIVLEMIDDAYDSQAPR